MNTTMPDPSFALNGIEYRWPRKPTVVVCIDGCDPSYLQSAKHDSIPNIKRLMREGCSTIADSVVPTLTNPNNVSIVTGSPPRVHGINGNYFLDPVTEREVMMDDPSFVRSETILAQYSKHGARVAVITAKDKLLGLLGAGIRIGSHGICFSAERATECTFERNGIDDVLTLVGRPRPDVYSAELSIFVLKAAHQLLRHWHPDIMFLSLSDYVQHSYPPGTPQSDDFLSQIDAAIGQILERGVALGLTADHGMSDKALADGSPNIVYLQDELDCAFGAGSTKVILPITDPYVVHHGSLGGFVRVYCSTQAPADEVDQLTQKLPGIAVTYDKSRACRLFELPEDREADLVAIADRSTVIGTAKNRHDLSQLQGRRLRSHGGLSEQKVPFIVSLPLDPAFVTCHTQRALHNYEIFDFLINGPTS